MLKKISLILICLFICITTFAENYTIIHVKGIVRLKRNGKNLNSGDQISSDDQVIFTDKDALAIVFSPSKGRFTLSPGPKSNAYGAEFIAYVKNALVPGKSSLSTRGGTQINNIIEFKTHFGSCKYLILETAKVKVSEKAFAMTDQSFLYVRFVYNGEQINKKLESHGEWIKLSRELILKVDEQSIDPAEASEFQFFYYNSSDQSSRFICDFDPAFPTTEELRPQIGALVSVMKDNKLSEDKVREEVNSFLIEYYGHPDKSNLEEWMSAEFSK